MIFLSLFKGFNHIHIEDFPLTIYSVKNSLKLVDQYIAINTEITFMLFGQLNLFLTVPNQRYNFRNLNWLNIKINIFLFYVYREDKNLICFRTKQEIMINIPKQIIDLVSIKATL